MMIRQCCSHDKSTIQDPHAMMNFILFSKATKDADGLGDAGLVDKDLRKSSLQSGVSPDLLPILHQSRRTNAAKLSVGK